jgi:serine protease Do
VMTYDGDTYGVSLVGYDVKNDIAILRMNSNQTFSFFDFGDSDSLKAGQKVVALGNPAGLSFTATEGIVSSPSRLADDGLYYIQTDVTLNPGNSGGPLINSRGELIGIVDFKVSGYEELGFAIPSNRADDVIGDILDAHSQ